MWDFKQVENTKKIRHSNNYKSALKTLKVSYGRAEVWLPSGIMLHTGMKAHCLSAAGAWSSSPKYRTNGYSDKCLVAVFPTQDASLGHCFAASFGTSWCFWPRSRPLFPPQTTLLRQGDTFPQLHEAAGVCRRKAEPSAQLRCTSARMSHHRSCLISFTLFYFSSYLDSDLWSNCGIMQHLALKQKRWLLHPVHSFWEQKQKCSQKDVLDF